jgi:pyruvate/2-oxoglutarate dehydrogenase complex dihydrolipoamide dehydrogenase (E3) component
VTTTPTQQPHFDVIGSRPAGQKAAIQAAKAGELVAVVERDRQVGGNCAVSAMFEPFCNISS